MKLQHLERLAGLLATREHTPIVRRVGLFAGKRGYYLDDDYLGANVDGAFMALVDKIEARMAWELRDMPQSAVATRRGRAGVGN